jgi:hypothetical protein
MWGHSPLCRRFRSARNGPYGEWRDYGTTNGYNIPFHPTFFLFNLEILVVVGISTHAEVTYNDGKPHTRGRRVEKGNLPTYSGYPEREGTMDTAIL